jgi:hypothetical protein
MSLVHPLFYERKEEMKVKIRLEGVTDIANFVLAISDVKSDVYVTSGRICISGKSFLGLAHAKEFHDLWCECEEDIYRKIEPFVVIG